MFVLDLKSKFGPTARSIEAAEGEELRLHCAAPEGNPAPSIYWERDGETLLKDDFFRVEKNGDLVIPSAGLEDAGGYVCAASSAGVTRRDAEIRVRVTRRRRPKQEPAVVIDRVVVPTAPVISEAYMLDSSTGLVHWSRLEDVEGYTVMLASEAGVKEVTNISVEQDVNQVKLHR